MMEGQERRDEGGKDRRCADVADDRDALAQFGAGKAAHRQENDRHQNIRRHRAGGGEAADHADEDDKNRQRNDADLKIDERPPALRPKTLGAARLSLRHATDFLRHRMPSPFLSSRGNCNACPRREIPHCLHLPLQGGGRRAQRGGGGNAKATAADGALRAVPGGRKAERRVTAREKSLPRRRGRPQLRQQFSIVIHAGIVFDDELAVGLA